MKQLFIRTLLGMGCLTYTFAHNGETMQYRMTNAESRASIVVKESEYKDYFTGDVRVDMLYPQSDAKTHSGANVTFEPCARTHWHTHPAGQHIIVTSGVGYYQALGEPIVMIKAGDVIWVPAGLKHWHGASKAVAMTHFVITGADVHGKNVEWLEPVSAEQYAHNH